MMDRRSFVGCCAAGTLTALRPPPSLAAEGSRTVAFSDGTNVSALGQGSWHMADGRTPADKAEDAMRLGISLGLTLIDTSDDYGAGRAEAMVAKVIAGQREKVFLVSKLDPLEATSDDKVEQALRASLKRLGTDKLDLYLLHQRRGADVKAAVKGLERVCTQGLVTRWGVSNFGVKDMEEVFGQSGGTNCATNQVLYNLAARDIEADLMPWAARHKMPLMAYSPLGAGGKGALLGNSVLMTIGLAHGVAAAVVALAWAMRDRRTIVVTETGSSKHVRENAEAVSMVLSADELKALDAAFPPPRAR